MAPRLRRRECRPALRVRPFRKQALLFSGCSRCDSTSCTFSRPFRRKSCALLASSFFESWSPRKRYRRNNDKTASCIVDVSLTNDNLTDSTNGGEKCFQTIRPRAPHRHPSSQSFRRKGKPSVWKIFLPIMPRKMTNCRAMRRFDRMRAGLPWSLRRIARRRTKKRWRSSSFSRSRCSQTPRSPLTNNSIIFLLLIWGLVFLVVAFFPAQLAEEREASRPFRTHLVPHLE